MNELQIFSNEEFGSVRTLTIDDDPWFVGKDVANALGYKNTKDALVRHIDDEDRRGSQITTPSGAQQMTVINESGLYSLILQSKLPSAKRFKRWVTSEVLPTIRRTGSYNVLESPSEPLRSLTTDDYLRAASIVAGCRSGRLPYVSELLKKAGIDLNGLPVTSESVSLKRQVPENPWKQRKDVIAAFVSRKVPRSWKGWTLKERRRFWNNPDEEDDPDLVERDFICALEIYCELFGGEQEDFTNSAARGINDVLRFILDPSDWSDNDQVVRTGPYGSQRAFKRLPKVLSISTT